MGSKDWFSKRHTQAGVQAENQSGERGAKITCGMIAFKRSIGYE
jgi:hypothetical protein